MSVVARACASAALLVAAALTLTGCLPDPFHEQPDPEPTYPALPASAPLPPSNPSPTGFADLADPAWVQRVAASTGIPQVALAAYAAATITKDQQMPECRLAWNTLAAIGYAESDHGRHGGSALDANGTAVPPIYGPPLVGDGTDVIPDSDGGQIDGDATTDRAVGPMQFIPEAWRNWHIDANGDGVEDPQNIYDASVATANYLCRAAGELGTRDGWLAGIASYNSSVAYADKVADAANSYADAAAG